MKIKLSDAAAVFAGLGFQTAVNWNAERMQIKLDKIATIIDDENEVDPSIIAEKGVRKLFDSMKEAMLAKKKVVVIDDSAEVEDDSEETATKAKPEKKEKKSKKAKSEEDSDEGKNEPDEAPSEDAEEEAPKKKKAAKEEESEDDESDDEDDSEDTEAPAKKKKKAGKASKSASAKDKFGLREGTAISKIALALTSKSQTQGALTKAAKLSGTNYEALAKLVEKKIAVLVDEDGKAWKLRK